MRTLPVFLDLSRGPVVVVGNSSAAEAKVRILRERGAEVRLLDTVTDGSELARAIAVVVAAGEDDERVASLSIHLNIPVNVIDRPELSTFLFPAIVDRGDVVVAVSTGGASPVLARRIRERIEAILPARLSLLAQFLGRLRGLLKSAGDPNATDRSFWQRLIDSPVARDVLDGRAGEPAFVHNALKQTGDREGHVTLVGAGPGDPDLLTLKALHALQDADVVFYDELVTPEILARARRDAARILVGRRKGQPGVGQHAVHEHMVAAARGGHDVVRLKGGDPFVFGRGGEEVEALRAAGVSVSVVPGITAALGCAAEAELPLTFRNEATRLIVATAHAADDAEAVDWSGMADRTATLAIYMGLTAAPAVRDGLIAAGRDPATLAAVLARGTRSDSRAVTGTLAQLPALAARAGEGPALIVVGDVVRHSRPWRDAQSTQWREAV